MSMSIKVAWDCECNPSYTTGYIDGDTDTVRCSRCDGTIKGTESITIEELQRYRDNFNREHGLAL